MLLSHKSGTKVTLFLIYNKFICLFIQSFYYPPIVFRFFRQPCNPLSAEKSRPPRNRFCLCIGTTYRIQKHKYPYNLDSFMHCFNLKPANNLYYRHRKSITLTIYSGY